MIVVSTDDTKSVKAELTLSGIAMDEMAARRLANDLGNDFLRYRLGLNMDAEITVTVAVDPAPVMEPDEPTNEVPIVPETPAVPVKATREEIAAMSTPEYRAAKAAGRI